MDSQVQFYPPVPVKQFMVGTVETHVDGIKKSAEKILKKFDHPQENQNSKSFFQRHFFPVFFIDNSTRLGGFSQPDNYSNIFLRVVVGVVSTVGILLGADSLGEATAELITYKGIRDHSRTIRGESDGTYECTPKTKALEVAKNSKKLAGRVIKYTFCTNVGPKIAMVSGCAISLFGALINLPIAMMLGFGLGVMGFAGKLYSKKAFAAEEEKIVNSAHLLIGSIQEFNQHKNEATLPAYNPEWMIQ